MHFSITEREHLLKAWVAISFAFAVLIGDFFSLSFVFFFAVALGTVGLGFMLHEVAHKYIATRFGCAAEFRADNKMLAIAVMSSFFGFIFAAPGAVIILGHVTVKKSGIISLAGPSANIVLSLIFLIISFLDLGTMRTIALYGAEINAFLAMFNMIPILNYDGAKILAWNKIVYFGVAALSVGLVFGIKILPLG